MKKIAVMVSALVLRVALGAATLATGATKTIRVKTKITATFTNGTANPTPPYQVYTEDKFSGKVKSKKRACRKGRTVKIVGTTLKTKSNKQGNWAISAGNMPKGTYTAKAKKKVIKKPNKRIVCKKAFSKPVVVP